MKINKENLAVLMKEKADNNYNKFAKMLNIDVGYLHKVVNGKCGAGAMFVSKIIAFCKNNLLDFNQYVDLYND